MQEFVNLNMRLGDMWGDLCKNLERALGLCKNKGVDSKETTTGRESPIE